MAKDIKDVYRSMLSGGTFDDDAIFHPDLGVLRSRTMESDEDMEIFDTSEEIAKEEEAKREAGESGNPYDIEEHVTHYKRYTKRREHKYTESEMEEIRQSCVETIVHDYAERDEYHISDEERLENDSLKEIAVKLAGAKKVYRNIVQYIYAMRTYVEAWKIVERKENYIHDKDEFFEMVGDGRIYHTRLIKPVYSGKTKYSIDTIIQYVSNPELDPHDIEVKINDTDYDEQWYKTDEELADDMERLLSPSEAQYLAEHADNPEMMYVKETKRKYIDGYDQKIIGRRKKKGSKKERFKKQAMRELLNHIQQNPHNSSSRGFFTSSYSMFDVEEEREDYLDMLRYDGSWQDEAGVELFELAQEELRMSQRIPGNSWKTYGDVAQKQFIESMENAGMNVTEFVRKMNQSQEQQQQAEQQEQYKRNRKIEAKLIERITKLNQSSKFKKLIAKTEKAANSYKIDE